MDEKTIGGAALAFANASILRVLLAQFAANTTDPVRWLEQTKKLVETEIKNGSPPPAMSEQEASLLIRLALASAAALMDVRQIERGGFDPGADTRK